MQIKNENVSKLNYLIQLDTLIYQFSRYRELTLISKNNLSKTKCNDRELIQSNPKSQSQSQKGMKE